MKTGKWFDTRCGVNSRVRVQVGHEYDRVLMSAE